MLPLTDGRRKAMLSIEEMNRRRKYLGYTYAKHLWGIVGMPGYEKPARTPEELEAYLKVRKGPWEMSYEEGKKLIIK